MDAHEDVKKTLNEYMNRSKYTIVKEPSSVEEFKLLHELEHSMPLRLSDNLFVRSRVYCLIASFVSKIAKHTHTDVIKKKIDYDQIANMDTIIQNNLKAFPKLDILAKKVNLSVSSLLRQFKFLYGKSIYEYYVEKKMEYAKKMLLETGTSIKNMANYLGYKQSSHFIKAFVKYHGYSPGTLKALNNDWITL